MGGQAGNAGMEVNYSSYHQLSTAACAHLLSDAVDGNGMHMHGSRIGALFANRQDPIKLTTAGNLTLQSTQVGLEELGRGPAMDLIRASVQQSLHRLVCELNHQVIVRDHKGLLGPIQSCEGGLLGGHNVLVAHQAVVNLQQLSIARARVGRFDDALQISLKQL